jgi:hypothetical protein
MGDKRQFTVEVAIRKIGCRVEGSHKAIGASVPCLLGARKNGSLKHQPPYVRMSFYRYYTRTSNHIMTDDGRAKDTFIAEIILPII